MGWVGGWIGGEVDWDARTVAGLMTTTVLPMTGGPRGAARGGPWQLSAVLGWWGSRPAPQSLLRVQSRAGEDVLPHVVVRGNHRPWLAVG